MASLRVKVRVSDLIAAIEARRTEYLAECDAADVDLPDRIEEWKTTMLSDIDVGAVILSHARSDIASGKDVSSFKMPVWITWGNPTKMPHPTYRNTTDFDRNLATLRMTSEEVISITADDYARYIR